CWPWPSLSGPSRGTVQNDGIHSVIGKPGDCVHCTPIVTASGRFRLQRPNHSPSKAQCYLHHWQKVAFRPSAGFQEL
ncbi:MAG TPA: hypothetical protein VJ323_06445, partial [Bryobacteraceae bacterium]|nr:hypothetical protein [Bryobacteraceae bacterium]